MIDYLTQVKPLEDAGFDDTQIAEIIASATVSAIPIADLENFLDFEALAKRNAITASWEGVLPDEITNNAFGLSAGLSQLFNHLNKHRSTVVDTTVQPWAVDAKDLTNGLLAAGLITQAQLDAFYALGGGRPNSSVVVQDVVDSRNSYNAEQAEIARQDSIRTLQAEIENTYINPAIADGVSDEATVRAAIKAGL
jgi:hypothetical protein